MALDSNMLAVAMEDQLDQLSQAAGKGPLPDLGKEDRHRFFLAIAIAVVEHVQASAEVKVDHVAGNPTNGTGTIE